jgi:hypothetical protein
MYTLKLNIQDSVFDKIMYFLQNLPKNEVSIIIEDKIVNDSSADFNEESSEVRSFSNHTANLIEEWRDTSEDDAWK